MKKLIKNLWALRHKVVFKILLYFLLFALCSLFSLLVVYYYYNDFFRNDAETHYVSALGHISENVNNIFSEIYLASSLLPRDEYFQTLIASRQPLEAIERPALTQSMYTLRVFRSTKNYIDNAFLIDTEEDLIVSGNGTISIDLFFDKTSRFAMYTQAQWLNLPKANFLVMPAMEVTDSTTGNRTVIPVVQNKLGEYVTSKTFVVTLNADYFAKLLSAQKITENSVLLFSNGEGDIYAATNPIDADYAAWHKENVAQYAGDGFQLARTTDYHGNGLIAVTFHSNVLDNDFFYSAYIPYDDLWAKTNYIKKLTLGVSILMMISAACIFLIAAFKLNNPIRKLVQRLYASTQSAGSVDPINELDFLDNRLSRLLDESAQMKSDMSIMQPLAVERYLFRILNGLELPIEDARNFAQKKLDFPCGYPLFYAAVLQLKRTDVYKAFFREDNQGQLMSCLTRQLEQFMAAEPCVLRILPLEPERDVLIVNAHAAYGAERFYGKLREFVGAFSFDSLYILLAGVGTPCDGLHDMMRSYREASEALAVLSRHAPERVGMYSGKKSETEYLLSYNDETMLFNFLMGGMDADARRLIVNVVKRNKENGVSRQHLKQLYNQLCLICCRVVKYKALEIDGLLTADQREILSDYNDASVDDMAEVLEVLLRGVLVSFSSEGRKTDIDSVKRYIEAHFAEDVNVESIAEHFSLSSPYLTKLFKDAYGIPVKQFISLKRIERTKELLSTSNLSISQIAESVGFNNRNSFLRMFQKMEGVTPTEYRKNMKT